MSTIQYVVIADQPAPKEKTNHILHLILTIITGGLWVIVWLGASMATEHKNKAIARSNARLRQAALPPVVRQIEGQVVKAPRDPRTLVIFGLVAALGAYAMSYGIKHRHDPVQVAIKATAPVVAPVAAHTPSTGRRIIAINGDWVGCSDYQVHERLISFSVDGDTKAGMALLSRSDCMLFRTGNQVRIEERTWSGSVCVTLVGSADRCYWMPREGTL